MNYRDQIRNEYFEWLYNYICGRKFNNRISFRKLFMLLHSIDFDFYIPDDSNRTIDGVNLRNRFANYMHDEEISNVLDEPCSVLEMMLALAIRCEETIMDNPEYGDRTVQWFWNMLTNLNLNRFSDDVFNEDIARDRIYNFIERKYEPDGKGGLFYIRNCPTDLRTVDIWTQLCWYLDNYN